MNHLFALVSSDCVTPAPFYERLPSASNTTNMFHAPQGSHDPGTRDSRNTNLTLGTLDFEYHMHFIVEDLLCLVVVIFMGIVYFR